MMTPYVVTRYYRAPEVVLGLGYQENGTVLKAVLFIFSNLIQDSVSMKMLPHATLRVILSTFCK